MIAVKREVAVTSETNDRFSVERMSSYNTDDKSLYQFKSTERGRNYVCELQKKPILTKTLLISKDTHGTVYSHRLSHTNVRKGGDFFYGKSNYENYP